MCVKDNDAKGKSNSWRQGLSHWLGRKSKPGTNSNNNVVSRLPSTGNSANPTTVGAKTGNSVNNGKKIGELAGSPVKTQVTTTGNSVSSNKMRTENEVIVREEHYRDIDAKWTASYSPQHKCSKLFVESEASAYSW